MENYVENIKLIVTTHGLKILIGIALFFIGKWLSRFVSEKASNYMLKKKFNEALCHFTKQILNIIIMICVVLGVLQYVGVPTGQFMVILGSASLAVGLAMKDTLSNFACGMIIVTLRPFNVGDFVNTGGQTGTVSEIQLLNTIVNSPDNIKVIIPNGKILSDNISNYTANGKRRVEIPIGVSYDEDLSKVIEKLITLMKDNPKVLAEPAPFAGVTEYGDSSINLIVRPWVDVADYWDVYFDINKGIKATFDEDGISIPFPQRVVHMQNQTS